VVASLSSSEDCFGLDLICVMRDIFSKKERHKSGGEKRKRENSVTVSNLDIHDKGSQSMRQQVQEIDPRHDVVQSPALDDTALLSHRGGDLLQQWHDQGGVDHKREADTTHEKPGREIEPLEMRVVKNAPDRIAPNRHAAHHNHQPIAHTPHRKPTSRRSRVTCVHHRHTNRWHHSQQHSKTSQDGQTKQRPGHAQHSVVDVQTEKHCNREQYEEQQPSECTDADHECTREKLMGGWRTNRFKNAGVEAVNVDVFKLKSFEYCEVVV